MVNMIRGCPMGQERMGQALGDRARGLMVGLAAGNLLGIPFEGMSHGEFRHIRSDGIAAIEARHGYPDDDDIAQAIVLAQALADGPLDPDDLARRFWFWGEINGAGMGGLTRRALTNYGGSPPQCLARNRSVGEAREPAGITWPEASRLAWEGWRAGNGAVMRCPPIAIRWWRASDTAALVGESLLSALPTHWDPACGWSCAVLNLAVGEALRGGEPVPGKLLRDAKAFVDGRAGKFRQYGLDDPALPEEVADAVWDAWESPPEAITADGPDMGHAILTLRLALSALRHAGDFADGLLRVVGRGGDTDTNGAVAGAVLGSCWGLRGIPDGWIRQVRQIREGRVPMEWYADRILNGERAGSRAGP